MRTKAEETDEKGRKVGGRKEGKMTGKKRGSYFVNVDVMRTEGSFGIS